jgi:pyrimidine-nucleoside phosphorylase
VRRQGGDVSFIEHLEKYPRSKYSGEIKSSHSGFVTGIDSLELGLTGIELGAGRTKVDDVIDPKAGIMLTKKVGDAVSAGDTLAIFYTDNKNIVEQASERITGAFAVGISKPDLVPLIISQVDENGIKPFMN